MSKYEVMTDCRTRFEAEDQDRQSRFRRAAFFLFVYIPVMTVTGMLLLAGYLPL